MLRRGILSVAAYAQAQRACAVATKQIAGARALSATSGENDDPTPAKTKLTFASDVYGKDPKAAAALSDIEAAEVEELRMKAQAEGGGGATAAPIHDSRNMYDSSFQQAEDGKASGDIKRDVSADTPDATRVAFGASDYGKDPQAAAEENAEAEVLRMKVHGVAADGAAAAPIHSSRSLFDSDLTQGSGTTHGSDSIKRDVKPDTPEATRVVFRGSDYGKDPLSMSRTAEEQAEIETLASRVGAGTVTKDAAPIHHERSMFDSDLTQGAGSTQGSESINRDVKPDTPTATRVVFRGSDYGKDPLSMSRTAEEQAEIDKLASRVGAGTAAKAAAPIHHERSMFDSDLTQGAGSAQGSESINRDVKPDTPTATRVVFRGSDYGKDPLSMSRTAEEQAEIDKLASRVGAGTAAKDAAPIHHERSMFDSDLTQGAGSTQGSESIKRDVKPDTPTATRVVFRGSDYGKDPLSMSRTAEEQAEIDKLASRVGAGTAAKDAAPIHHERSMFDSDLTEGVGASPEFKAINRRVETATPALTRLSFFGSTYGDEDPGESGAEHARLLAEKQRKGERLAPVEAGVRKSKVHDTKKAMADDVYSQAGSE